MVEPCTAGPFDTLVSVKLALMSTAVTTVTVLLAEMPSAVVLVPKAVLVMLPVLALTDALTINVKVWPIAKLAVNALALEPATVVVAWLELALIRTKPALITSVIVTFCAIPGPKLTSVTV